MHLLILAANAGVPGLGIERGSKITNWLKAFQRKPSGSVDNCDLKALEHQILEMAGQPWEELHAKTLKVMEGMHTRLDKASELLKQVLSGMK